MSAATRPLSVFGIMIALFSVALPAGRADDWPQWRGPQRDGVWRETGLIREFPAKGLTPRWQAPISSGYSGPTVAAGRVYVTDRVTRPTQQERVHCFDAQTGKPIWSHAYDCRYEEVSYDAGPRASVLIQDGLAYSLGTMGNLFCFDAADGAVRWQHDLRAEYKTRMPIWGIAASPLVFEDLLIVMAGGENACLVAFDRKTGEERWKALNDPASYSAPILVEQAGRPVLVAWTGTAVNGLDPRSGKPLWRHDWEPARMVINVATPVQSGNELFFTSFYDGCQLLRLDPDKLAVSPVWRRSGPNEQETDGLHSIISTPLFRGDFIYGVDSYGELRCLDRKNGDRVWESLAAVPRARWATIHFVRNGDDIWMFNERGELIIARLDGDGFHERSRTKILAPTEDQLRRRGGVCWSHPAFADRCVFARNDNELVCYSLAAQP